MRAAPRGLFVGLATLDVIHRVAALPGPNQKITALTTDVAAGGPAAVAAITFAALGGSALLVTALGPGAAADAVRADLAGAGVEAVDVAPPGFVLPPASVLVVEGTGERSVVGGGAGRIPVTPPADADVVAWAEGAEVLLIDGHHPEVAVTFARAAAASGCPVVADLGSAKPVYDRVLPRITDAICSADYRTADGSAPAEMLGRGPLLVAVSHGPDPLEWWTLVDRGSIEVPPVAAVDTLGAGDVLHGAYAFALAAGKERPDALRTAVRVAGIRVAHIGPREWRKVLRTESVPGSRGPDGQAGSAVDPGGG